MQVSVKTCLFRTIVLSFVACSIVSYLYFRAIREAPFVIGSSRTTICVDGAFAYHLSSKVVNSENQPISNTEVIAFDDDNTTPLNRPDWMKSTLTDVNGRTELTIFTGPKWGGVYEPDRDPRPEPPVPSNPKLLYLWYRDKEGQWNPIEVQVKDDDIREAENGALHIHIDQITLARAAWQDDLELAGTTDYADYTD